MVSLPIIGINVIFFSIIFYKRRTLATVSKISILSTNQDYFVYNAYFANSIKKLYVFSGKTSDCVKIIGFDFKHEFFAFIYYCFDFDKSHCC